MGDYRRRIVDDELDELAEGLPAILIEGARGVGKTSTARVRAKTFWAMDEEPVAAAIGADPSLVMRGEPPVLIDEWQRIPATFDVVRRAVDADRAPGRFLLTGSAHKQTDTHSGAGRVVSVQMRPLSLAERGVATPTVSLRALLAGAAEIAGDTEVALSRYVEEIAAGGFPGMRSQSGRLRRAELSGYVERLATADFRELDRTVRNPAALLRWMRAYAAATSTTATYESIRDAATGGVGEKPPRSTTTQYADALQRLWILDPVDAWLPQFNPLKRLGASPKHHLVDPALAVTLLELDEARLLAGHPMLGQLFEALVAQSLRIYAQASEAAVGHLRTHRGEREIDYIVHGVHGTVAVEVKLSQAPDDRDVRHLLWLKEQLGNSLADMVVITAGRLAYRRPDGVAVIPAALLGP